MKYTQKAVRGDCVEYLKESNDVFQLCIADPPYNTGQAYEAYSDNLTYKDYCDWSRLWLTAVTEHLHKHGALFVFAPDEWVSEIDMLCRKKLHYYKQRQIVWSFTFGQKANKNFTRSHVHILYFTRAKTIRTFNIEAISVPSARQLVYNDSRANPDGKPPDDTWMLLKDQLEPYMTPDTDTWLVSRICGTFKEREKHSPNQIPLPIMERIVLACSDKSDNVLDPFCGTGSSGVACAAHSRRWLGLDISKTCVKESQRRVNETIS